MASSSEGSSTGKSKQLSKGSFLKQHADFQGSTEYAVEIQRSVEEYINNTFGTGKLQSETEFVNELHKTGRLSYRLVIIYIFTLWYIAVVEMHRHIIGITDKVWVRCEIPALEACKTFNFSTITDISIGHRKPTVSDPLSIEYCTYGDYEYKNFVLFYGCNYEKIKKAVLKMNRTKQIPCRNLVKDIKAWNYSKPFSTRLSRQQSIKDAFNVFCQDTWTMLFWFAFNWGELLSILLIGPIADIYGRKPAFMIASLLHLLGFLLFYIPLKWCMVLGRFLTGARLSAEVILYLLFSELCSKVTLLWMGLLICPILPVSNAISTMLYYVIKKWKTLHLLNTCLLLPLPLGLWYITESPRWLMFTGNKSKAWKTLRDCGSKAEPNIDDLNTPEPNRPKLREIWRSLTQPVYGQRAIICSVVWFFNAISIFINDVPIVEDLSYKLTHAILLVSVIELLTELFGGVAAIRLGRRTAVFTLYCLLMFLDAAIFMEYPDRSLAIAGLLCGHLRISEVAFHVLLFYTMELFPTPHRATAVCGCLSMYEFGSMILKYVSNQSYTSELRAVEYYPIFIATIACALLICLFPETKNDGLPDTYRDALYLKNIS